MLKFINLENGSIYSGIQPYIHWFPGQQSTGINYVMPIALLFEAENGIDEDVEETYKNIYIKHDNENSIFTLLNISNNKTSININDFEYFDLEELNKDDDIKSIGVPITNNNKTRYMHIFYVYAKSDSACECIDELTIYRKNPNNDEVIDIATINVGADFYNEDESLKINASNLGIHIPDSIQRAIYESDAHEEIIDNILINRKLKELLSNYWDVIANRGSYKSLINSLKWFEYGDLVRLREIWSHNVDGSFKYDDREVSAIMNDKYKDAFNNFYKTTSFAIYLALQHETGELDVEKNPVLAENIFKWALNDLAIKMSLLGNFYETYFMPIHTELLHCSIEDRVYTNNIKIVNNVLNSWHDIVDCTESFECIVNDGKEIILGNVNAQVCESTPFVCEKSMVGVSSEPIKEDVSNDKYFYNQYYNGIGTIIPITCEFNVYGDERIVFGKIVWNGVEAYDYRLFTNESKDGKVTINFHLLVTKPTNKLNLFFVSTSGKHYTKQIDIIAHDNSYINLDIYRLKHVNEPISSEYANPRDGDLIQYSSFSMYKLDKDDRRNFEYFISYKTPFVVKLSGDPTYIYTIGEESYKGLGAYQARLTTVLNSAFNKTESIDIGESIFVDEIDGNDEELILVKSLINNESGIKIRYNIPHNNDLNGINQIRIPITYEFNYNKQIDIEIPFIASLVEIVNDGGGNKINRIIDTFDSKICYKHGTTYKNADIIFKLNKKDLSKYSSIGLEIQLLQPSQDIYTISSFDWMFFESFKVTLGDINFLNDGIALSNVVFMDAKKIRDDSSSLTADAYITKINTLLLNKFKKESIANYYFIYIPPTIDDKEPDHIVLISKYFYDNIYKYIEDNPYIKFQDLRYIERFHIKEPIGDTNMDDSNDSLEKYCVGKYDDLFVTPQIHIGDKVYPLLYKQNVESASWKFINKSLNEESSFLDPREPYISSNSRKMLDHGYYDIEFNYSLVDGTSKTITKNSAFLKLDY